MVNAKRGNSPKIKLAVKELLVDRLGGIYLCLFFVVYALGQLLRIEYTLFNNKVVVNPLDVLAGLSIFFYQARRKVPKVASSFATFIFVAFFSFLLSLSFYSLKTLGFGWLYILRLFAYLSFFIFIVKFTKQSLNKKIVFYLLLMTSSLTAILSWLQYFFFPDLRWLANYGWDDHLYRLVGTFLDPGFTGVIMVFGFILSTLSFLYKKRLFYLVLSVLFLLSVAFTYSRASYLALTAVLLYLIFTVKESMKYSILFLLTFSLIVIFFLPRQFGEGTKLERTESIRLRINNYQQTLSIWKQSPLFGVGFNNICFARQKYFGFREVQSHSCQGSDSSLLFILATAGIVGMLVFFDLGRQIFLSIDFKKSERIYTDSFLACSLGLFVHSLFLNSLFYPWVMAFVLALLSTSLKKQFKE